MNRPVALITFRASSKRFLPAVALIRNGRLSAVDALAMHHALKRRVMSLALRRRAGFAREAQYVRVERFEMRERLEGRDKPGEIAFARLECGLASILQ